MISSDDNNKDGADNVDVDKGDSRGYDGEIDVGESRLCLIQTELVSPIDQNNAE